MSQSEEQYLEETKRAFEDVLPVYVSLKVSIGGEAEDVTDVLLRGDKVCLTAPFGSGKTTVLRHLAAFLAESRDPRPPIFVPMRNARGDLSGMPARTLLGECGSPVPPKELLDHLEDGGSAFILLDGLDEMPPATLTQFPMACMRWEKEYKGVKSPFDSSLHPC